MPTFDDLGVPFPLFAAPTSETSDYAGVATCRLCQVPDRHCFEFDALMLACPSCGAENGLPVRDRTDAPCRSCLAPVPFPERLKTKKQFLACYECLRAGRVALAKDTELGLISWDQAFRGITNGVPGLQTDQFDPVLIEADPDGDWYGVRLPVEDMWELLRTPTPSSWQGERWLFCCRRPMSYLGGWRNALEVVRPDEPVAFFESLFNPGEDPRNFYDLDFEPDDPRNEDFDMMGFSLYVYRCRTCSRCRATWDDS